MKALIKAAVVGIGCAGAMRFAAYRRFGTWVLCVIGGTRA